MWYRWWGPAQHPRRPASERVSRVGVSDDLLPRGRACRPAQIAAPLRNTPKALAELRLRHQACVIEVEPNTHFRDEPRSVRFHLLRAEFSRPEWLGELTPSGNQSNRIVVVRESVIAKERDLCRRRRAQQERQARCEPCSLMHRQRPLRGWCISSPIPDSGFRFSIPVTSGLVGKRLLLNRLQDALVSFSWP